MRPEPITMAAPQTTGASPGAAIIVDRFRDKSVQFASFSTGTHQVEGSIDGTAYSQIGGDVTAPGFVDLPNAVKFIRITCTVNITGGPSEAFFMGFDSRTD